MEISEITRKYLITNLFNYIYFWDVLARLGFILLIGGILVLLFNIKNLKNIFNSITFKKFIGWVIMAPTFIISVMCGGLPSLILISFIVYKCLKEFFNIFYLPKFYFIALIILWFVTVISVILSSLNILNNAFDTIIYILPLIYLISLAVISIIRGRIEEIMKRVSYSFFASIWICYSMMHFILLARLDSGKELLLTIGFSVAISDISAFCIGKLFDKIEFGTQYKIAENISKNKTYAGILGNIFGSGIGVIILLSILPNINLISKIILIILIGVSASLGDMLESMVKRAAGTKDTSDTIPGHGGFLDRIDSLLIVIVVVYYYLYFLLRIY